MGSRLKDRLLATCALVLSAGAAMPSPALAQAVPGPEEIVVTANKRAQALVDVATSVTVVSTRELQDRGLNTLTDWASTVPGMSFFGRGSAGFNQVILRGITSGSQQTSSTVAFYLNETPFGPSIPFGGGASILQPDVDPFDLQQIEVLRGPQGTLYGANTLGGLIKYVLKDPDPRSFSGVVRAEGRAVSGGEAGYTFRGSLNAPVVTDKLAIRVSGVKRHDPGYIDNIATRKSDADSVDADGARISLGFTPTDRVKFTLTALLQDNVSNSLSAVDASPTTLKPLYGDLKKSNAVEERFANNYRLIDGTLNWDLGPVALVSSTSFSYIHSNIVFDFTRALAAALPGFPAVSGPQHLNYNRLTQELRLASPSGERLEWTGGFFYTKEEARAGSEVLGLNAALQPISNNWVLSLARSNGDFKSYAGFGNVSYKLAPSVDLSAGIRWSHNELDTQILTAGPLSGLPLAPFREQRGTSSESVWTYMASLNWRYAKDSSIYARAASGYRPGGPVEPPPGIPTTLVLPTQFKSDQVWNYEVGAKTSWLDGRLTLNAAAFYIDWSDIQLPFTVNGFRVLSNGSGATSKGAELEASWKPVDPFLLRLTASYAVARLSADAPLLLAKEGDRLPYAPRWTLAANADYQFAVTNELSGSVGATWQYLTRRNTSFDGDPSNLRIPGYATVDLRGNLFWDRYSVDVFARNIFDRRGYSSANLFGGVARLTPTQPLTVGVGFGLQF